MVAVPPTAPQNGPSRGRVLVVDDDAALAEMLGIVLRREGYEPAFVSDGSVFTTSGGGLVPTATIQAIALRAADYIKNNFKSLLT